MGFSGSNLYEVRRFGTVYRVMKIIKKNPLVPFRNYDAVKKIMIHKNYLYLICYIRETVTLLYVKHIL